MLKMYSQLKIVKKLTELQAFKVCEKRWKTAKIDVFSPKIEFILNFYWFSLKNHFYHPELHKISQKQIKNHENKKNIKKNLEFSHKIPYISVSLFHPTTLTQIATPPPSVFKIERRNLNRLSKTLFPAYIWKRNFELLAEVEFLDIWKKLAEKTKIVRKSDLGHYYYYTYHRWYWLLKLFCDRCQRSANSRVIRRGFSRSRCSSKIAHQTNGAFLKVVHEVL